MMLGASAWFLLGATGPQTDFGVRSVPGTPNASPPNAQVVRGANRSRAANTFSCRVASVHDGDTFRCADGKRIRLSAIDTPEMPGACQPGRSCAPGNPYAAKAALSRLISGRTVQCERVGTSYNRIAAWCSAGGMDLSCSMVRTGHAVRLARFDREGRLCR